MPHTYDDRCRMDIVLFGVLRRASSCAGEKHFASTQSTAWYMLHKIRLLYPQSDETVFDGTVECDEVYIGGKEKWKLQLRPRPLCSV